MIDHITIITKEAITRGLAWPPVVIGAVCITIMCVQLVRFGITKNADVLFNWMISITFIGIPVLFTSMAVCSIFFPVETGRYKYSGILDSDMSTVEFEEFNQTYSNIVFKDGVWYWEDK